MKNVLLKRMIIVLAGVFLFSGFSLSAQTAKIDDAIRKGNADELSAFFNSSLEIVLPGADGNMPKAKAAQLLKDFFTKNPPKSYVVRQTGKSSDTLCFVIGDYVSANGKKFNIHYVYKRLAQGDLIQIFNIEN